MPLPLGTLSVSDELPQQIVGRITICTGASLPTSVLRRKVKRWPEVTIQGWKRGGPY